MLHSILWNAHRMRASLPGVVIFQHLQIRKKYLAFLYAFLLRRAREFDVTPQWFEVIKKPKEY